MVFREKIHIHHPSAVWWIHFSSHPWWNLTDLFPVSIGVLQGCLLSSSLSDGNTLGQQINCPIVNPCASNGHCSNVLPLQTISVNFHIVTKTNKNKLPTSNQMPKRLVYTSIQLRQILWGLMLTIWINVRSEVLKSKMSGFCIPRKGNQYIRMDRWGYTRKEKRKHNKPLKCSNQSWGTKFRVQSSTQT